MDDLKCVCNEYADEKLYKTMIIKTHPIMA